MKPKLTPPALARINCSWFLDDGSPLVTPWQVVDEVAAQYRYRGSIVVQVKLDLLRYACLTESPVRVGIIQRRTYFAFLRKMADAWLAEGGHAWILAEIEMRGASRVVAFPGGGRHS